MENHGNLGNTLRATPARHLLTDGWNTFVNEKNMVTGDAVVVLRGQDEDLYIGIRKAKKGHVRQVNSPSVRNTESEDCETFLSTLLNIDVSKERIMRRNKVKAEAVIEAVNLAYKGKPFEVVYYP